MTLEEGVRVPRARKISLVPIHKASTQEPAAPGYGYTYQKLLDEFLQTTPIAGHRFDLYCLNEWLGYVNIGLSGQVGAEMTDQFEGTLTAFTNALGTKLADKTVRNIRGRIKALHGFYLTCLEKDAIPAGFFDALQFGMARMGLTPGRLIRLVGQTAYKWARGDSSPDPRHKERCGTNMQRLEEVLRFPPGTLAMRAWPAAKKIADLDDDIPFRRYMSVVNRHTYALDFEKFPKRLKTAWEAYADHKKQQSHLLPSGHVVTLALREVWSSESTCANALVLLRFFFGFLTLPKLSGSKPAWPESLKFGQGIPAESLRFTMLVQKDLLFAYMLYVEQRSFDRLHFANYEAQQEAKASGTCPPNPGSAAMRKSLPASFLRFLGLCINLINKETGFLRLHSEFGLELPQPVAPEDWEAWCAARTKELQALYKAADRKVEYNKRSNKEVLGEILRDEDPRESFLRVVDAMKKDVPPDTAPVWQAVHWRSLTIVALLTFACIRAKNVWMLDIGRHIIQSRGKYQLFIPKEEMKNFIHGHAEDISLEFPDDLQEILHTWITVYRPKIDGHDKTLALFVRQPSGPKSKRPDYYRLDSNRVGESIAKVTKKYLGVAIRTHGFRNVVPTSVAKMGGTPHQIKAVLNDSEKTALGVYLDIKNADQTQKLADLYNQSRARVN